VNICLACFDFCLGIGDSVETAEESFYLERGGWGGGGGGDKQCVRLVGGLGAHRA